MIMSIYIGFTHFRALKMMSFVGSSFIRGVRDEIGDGKMIDKYRMTVLILIMLAVVIVAVRR